MSPPNPQNLNPAYESGWRKKMYIIIFEADTFWGKTFDITLLLAILISVLAVMLETVTPIREAHGDLLNVVEWIFTILFTIEYTARVLAVKRPRKYVLSFFGIIDLISIIPTYLSLVLIAPNYLLIVRSIRLLRVFRIFKLVRYLGEANALMEALRASRAKIIVFLGAMFIVAVIMGSLMYIVEGGMSNENNHFTSIPRGIYWAIITLTTVGYGDIVPQTAIGQALAAMIMIIGYGVIAVPTGIVSAEMTKVKMKQPEKRKCSECQKEGHETDAEYCKFCGTNLPL